jgi:hypothetical protein
MPKFLSFWLGMLLPGHHPTVRPIRIRGFDPSMRCDTRKVVAYRVECPCGYRSRSVGTVGEARVFATAHRKDPAPTHSET